MIGPKAYSHRSDKRVFGLINEIKDLLTAPVPAWLLLLSVLLSAYLSFQLIGARMGLP